MIAMQETSQFFLLTSSRQMPEKQYGNRRMKLYVKLVFFYVVPDDEIINYVTTCTHYQPYHCSLVLDSLVRSGY